MAYGYVGNSAAVFPLQRVGVEVWPVHTVHFSNHTGYGHWRGTVFSAETVREVVLGIEERGVMPQCSGVLSGYMGDVSLGEVILEALQRVRTVVPNAAYCCDPVMGDVGRGMFVRTGIPEFMRNQAVPQATIVTPNQFELEYLSDRAITNLTSLKRAVNIVRSMGPRIVLVTSLLLEDSKEDQIGMLVAEASASYLVTTPRLPLSVNGAGDMTAALFFAHWLRTNSIQIALENTAAAVFAVLKKTLELGQNEIQLVAAQDEIVSPRRSFSAEQVW